MLSLDQFLARYCNATASQKQAVLEAARLILDGDSPTAQAAPQAEPYLNLRELAHALGFKSPVSAWRLGVHEVAEPWAGGRKYYRLSRVTAFLKTPAALKHREAIRELKRKNSMPPQKKGGTE